MKVNLKAIGKINLAAILLVGPVCFANGQANVVCKVIESPLGHPDIETKNTQSLKFNVASKMYRTEPLFQYGLKKIDSISVYANSKQNALTMSVYFQNEPFKSVRTSVGFSEDAYIHYLENDLNVYAKCHVLSQKKYRKVYSAVVDKEKQMEKSKELEKNKEDKNKKEEILPAPPPAKTEKPQLN